jgi:hypothetical protein
MSENTRGGWRPGSGRKPAKEKTKQMRVPVGLMPAVARMINDYNSEIETDQRKQGLCFLQGNYQAFKLIWLAEVERLPYPDRQHLIKNFGSLTFAAEVYAVNEMLTEIQKKEAGQGLQTPPAQ